MHETNIGRETKASSPPVALPDTHSKLVRMWAGDHERAMDAVGNSLRLLDSFKERQGSRGQSQNSDSGSSSILECAAVQATYPSRPPSKGSLRGRSASPSTALSSPAAMEDDSTSATGSPWTNSGLETINGLDTSAPSPSPTAPPSPRDREIEHLVSTVAEACKSHCLLKAHLSLQRLRSILSADEASVAEWLATAGHSVAASVSLLEDQVQQAKRALHGIDDLTGFDVARESNGLLVHYQHVAGTTVHSVRFDSTYDFSVGEILSLAREFDLVQR